MYYAERLFGLHTRHQARQVAREYVLWWIRNPAPGSFFDLTTWWFRDWLPTPLLFAVLRWTGRDAILLFDQDGKVVAHVFWHRRRLSPDRVYMFNVGVRKDARRQGLMEKVLCEHFLSHCYHTHGVIRVRLSAGGQAVSDPSSLLERVFIACSMKARLLCRRSARQGQSTINYDSAAVKKVYDKVVAGQVGGPWGSWIVGEQKCWLRFSRKSNRVQKESL